MKRLLVIFSIVFCLIFNCVTEPANADSSYVKENMKKELIQNGQSKLEVRERELVEAETFPFLPDNHRDSGTGKFMAFE